MPEAVGTGIIIQSDAPLGKGFERSLCETVSRFESEFSRFSDTSKVGMIASGRFDDLGADGSAGSGARHGGRMRAIAFPEYSAALFGICDAFCTATDGAFDPCVATELVRLGYGPDLAAHDAPEATGGAMPGGPRWGRDVTHDGATLILRGAAYDGVSLDFGAAGKGFLVDLLSKSITRRMPGCDFVIDAGGDMYTTVALDVAMESPWDGSQAVGVASIPAGSALCASSPSRRHWTASDGLGEVHHLLDALSGKPVRNVAATWCMVPAAASEWPTGWCDAQSTAAFIGLSHGFPFARLMDDGSAQASPGFPGRFFI